MKNRGGVWPSGKIINSDLLEEIFCPFIPQGYWESVAQHRGISAVQPSFSGGLGDLWSSLALRAEGWNPACGQDTSKSAWWKPSCITRVCHWSELVDPKTELLIVTVQEGRLPRRPFTSVLPLVGSFLPRNAYFQKLREEGVCTPLGTWANFSSSNAGHLWRKCCQGISAHLPWNWSESGP